MPRTPKFPYRKTDAGWMVTVGSTATASGKKERHFFPTRDEAKAHATKLREKFAATGAGASNIKPSLAEDATRAIEILKPLRMSLTEAAVAMAQLRAKSDESRTMLEAVDIWLLDSEGLRTKTQQGYRHTGTRLKTALGDKLLAEISGSELQKALVPHGTPATAAAGHIGKAKAFWNFCAEKKWCDKETILEVKAPRSREKGEIEILTPEQAFQLLHTAETFFPQAVSPISLQLFAGIRVEEITRLEEKHVTPDGIELTAAVTKKGRRRHITPNAALAAWLKAYPFAPCSNWKRTFDAVRRLAGWDLAENQLLQDRQRKGIIPKLAKPCFGAWPQNALRHSHASYAVASGTALETLLFEFGHTGNANVLRAHYVGRASKKQALAFFAMRPNGQTVETQLEAVS